MTGKRKPKFRRRAGDRPDEILDAALRLFLKHGFAQTTVQSIAAAAGLSKGALYLYFPSKEALLEGLVNRAVAPVAERVVADLSERRDHPRQAIAQALSGFAAALEDERTIAVPMLVIREAPQLPRIAAIYRERVLSRVLPALVGLIEDGIARGLIRPVDAELTVRTLVGPVVAHVILARVFGVVPPGGLALERFVAHHLDIVFRGLDPDRQGGRS